MSDGAANTGQTFAGAISAGTKVGRYEVVERIAVGGMAIIYKAYDHSLDRYVAVKQIAPHLSGDVKFVERFRQEAKVLARLSASQANLVAVHELIEQDQQLFIVMEYVEGSTLRQVMDRQAVPLQRGIGILLGVCLGLKAMHTNGVVHRDLTPSNIMLPPEGGAKISDFGLIGHAGGRTSMPMGTTRYMAPEMFTGGTIDGRADIYSLGFISYEMFCGPQVFAEAFQDVIEDSRAEAMRWMHWHANAQLTAPTLQELKANVPSLLSKIIERMMDKDPSRRFASVDQVIKWLRRIFVMHIQKRSMTERDSEKLTRQVEQEIGGEAQESQVPVLPDKRPTKKEVRARKRPPAPGAEEEPAEAAKTAPLPKRRLTKRQKLIYGGVALGVVLLGLISYGIYSKLTTGKLVTDANNTLRSAKKALLAGDYAGALEMYEEVQRKHKMLRDPVRVARAYAHLARAGVAMEEQKWDDALGEVYEAEDQGVKSTLIREFRVLLDMNRDIQIAITSAKQEEKLGNFLRAEEILLEIARKYPEANLTDRITALQQKVRQARYDGHIRSGDDAFDNGDIAGALAEYKLALKIMDTPEARAKQNKAKTFRSFQAFQQEGREAEKAKKWDVAVENYEKANKLQPSAKLKQKIDFCKAEKFVEEGLAFKDAGLIQKATASFVQALTLNPKHPIARAEVDAGKVQKQLEEFTRAGDNAMAAEDYAKAASAYRQARDIAKRSSDRKNLEKKLDEARFRATLAEGDAARDRQEWSAAEIAYKKALMMRPKDITIPPRLQELETLKQYQLHLSKGDEWLNQGNTAEAIKEYKLAQKVLSKPQVITRIRAAKYRQNVNTGRGAMAAGKYPEARAYFLTAKRLNDTDEVRKLIQEVKKAQEGGK